MSRTAQPATPGTDPNIEPEDEVTRLKREMADLKALVHQLGRNQAVESAEPVELPTMKSVIKQNPSIPVLTEEGWFVPVVHPTDRVTKL